MTGATIGGLTTDIVSAGIQLKAGKGDINKVRLTKVAEDTFVESVTEVMDFQISDIGPVSIYIGLININTWFLIKEKDANATNSNMCS